MNHDAPKSYPATLASFERIADELAEKDTIDPIDQGWSPEDAAAIMVVMRDIWREDYVTALADFRRRLVH